MPILILLIIIIVFLATSLKAVTTGYVFIVERFGKYHRTLEPGWHIVIPVIDYVRAKVSLKQQIVEIEPQSVITKDNVSVSIDNVVFFQVVNARDAIYNIENYKSGVIYSAAINMRDCVGALQLDEILSERAKLNAQILSNIESITRKYGVEILSVEIKNIIPPVEITASMEQVMTSERKKRAAILQAEGEKQAAISIAEGQKQAKILQAEAEKEANIRRAEGLKQSQLLEAQGKAMAIEAVAKAEAEATRLVNEAIIKSGTNEQVIALKQVEAMKEMAKNPANKLILPQESLGTFGMLKAFKEVFNDENSIDDNRINEKEIK
ncbi:peptidase [Clostridium polyendosporum]|uniref:Peptidase n=1 Tax=Clostridium polyendosporum TaxID=69208 RepID=A0A919VHI3_9CLOT|nr:SPFH domain-containing protein [Clostridium polyendosporum]GIM30287.1 peptidase [Clostridium polyendosporum]